MSNEMTTPNAGLEGLVALSVTHEDLCHLYASAYHAGHHAMSASPVIRDPHHGGNHQWQWRGGELYHLSIGASKWVKCKKVSATPARIKALYEALLQEQPQ